MKKKFIVTIMLIAVLFLATGGWLCYQFRHSSFAVTCSSWLDSDRIFTLCELPEEDLTEYNKSCFKPHNQELFLEQLTEMEEYIGSGVAYDTGVREEKVYFFTDGAEVFRLIDVAETGSYVLENCCAEYSGSGDGFYGLWPTPTDVYPENSREWQWDPETRQEFCGTFDERYESYEALRDLFYRYYEDIAVCDDENETITISVYDVYHQQFAEDRKVVIDFREKTVLEVITE